MVNNKRTGFGNSIFTFFRGFIPVNVMRGFVSRKQEAQDLRLPFNMKQIQ